MSAEPAVVLIEGLRCVAGTRLLLDLPRLAVCAGERVVLVGSNGAGKSTLLRCLGGFATPAQGQVLVLGQTLPLRRQALRRLRADVGQVLQGVHLVARLTVLENTLIGALGRLRGRQAWQSWWRRYPDADVAGAQQALQAVGLAGRDDERVDRLSGGERQKVAMARLLVQRPRLVLADEPTASLDPAAAREACALLGSAAEGATLISVVHDPALVPLLGTRVVGLRAGRLMFDRPAAEVDAAAWAALYAQPSPDGTMGAP